MAIKPWLGAIKAPSNCIPSSFSDEQPSINVTLEYAFGYWSKDCWNNIFLSDGNLYYHTAALAINLNVA